MMPPRLIGPRVVGDHGHAAARARRSCRRAPAASRPRGRSAGRGRPASLPASKTCSGRPRSKVTIVGDVDQRRDRPQADRRQPVLQPGRARPVAHAADEPADEQRAGLLLARREVEPRSSAPANRGPAPARSRAAAAGRGRRRRGRGRCRATPRQSARSGVSLMSITGPSRPEHLARRAGRPALGRQLDDAVMVLAEPQLARRAEHAVAGRRRGSRPS